MNLKVTQPFTEKDKEDLRKFSTETIKSGRKIDPKYTGFTRDEALALILAGTDFSISAIQEAQFILARALGELPDYIIDKDGKRIRRSYK